MPAILTDNLADASRALGAYQSLSPRVHIDVLDDTLVAGHTILPNELPPFAYGKRVWHLMVSNPRQYLADCLTDSTEAIIVHAELGSDAVAIADAIHAGGALAGLALNPKTPVQLIAAWLPAFDWVQIMTVEPGKQGGDFLPAPLLKISELNRLSQRVKTVVDGGVNGATIHQVLPYRPAMITVGSYLAPGPTLKEHWQELQQAIGD